jgi:integrase/recombinase XerD
MLSKNFSPSTVTMREMWLRHFVEWCDTRSLRRPGEITRPIIERYQRHWYTHRKTNGKPLSFRTQATRIVPIQSFFRWMTRQNLIASNPAADLDMPRCMPALPKHVLTPSEAEKVLSQPDVGVPLGVRDRAILEVLYSTGIRRKELAGLSIFDVDTERGTLRIRHGKGGRDRTVPVGERALSWIHRYSEEVRPSHVCGLDEQTLFLTVDGTNIGLAMLSQMVRRYVESAKTGKTGSCHLWRHSMATSMLENGADIRHVQEILGHVLLNTTTIYTHVAIRALKEVHTRTHPAALLNQPVAGAVSAGSASSNVQGVRPAESAEALLRALHDEDEDDDE